MVWRGAPGKILLRLSVAKASSLGAPTLRLAGQPQERRAKVSGVPVILGALSGAMALMLVEVH